MVKLKKTTYAVMGALLVAALSAQPALTARSAAVRTPAAALPLQELLQEKAATAPGSAVRVIVQATGDDIEVAQAARGLGGQVTHRWRLINGFAVEIPAGRLWDLARQPGVRWISWDSGLRANKGGTTGGPAYTISSAGLATAYPHAVRAVDVWNAGYYGTGVTIAMVDSGIEKEHADFSGRILDGVSVNPAAQYLADRYGHGTHVAGIAAGDGRTAGGKYIGIAPKANLLSVKFSGDDGTASESHLLNALDWVYRNRTRYNIRVVNISANAGTAQSYATSPLCAAVEKLWSAGIVVVVSAGNRGDGGDATHYPPANDPYVITVGASDDQQSPDPADDVQATWSSRGTTQDGFAKPDILAPGARIISTKAGNAAVLMQQFPENTVDTSYFRLGGTSMAAPMVSGAVALLLEKNPRLTPDQVKWLLRHTGRTWSGMGAADAPLLDAYAAATYSGSVGAANGGLAGSRGGGGAGDGTGSNVYWLSSNTY